jgi:predicted membrane protein
MKKNNWFWGVFFVLAAVFVIASQVTSFTQLGFWSIAFTVLLAAVFIQSLVNLNFFGVFMSLALAYWVYMEPLHLYIISPWLLILAAILVSIGFHMMFRRQAKSKYIRNHHDGDYRTIEDIDDNNPLVKVSFGSSSKYLHAAALKSGQFYCSCGALEVFFDQVQLDPAGAEIFVDCSLGEIKLFFPKNWNVVENMGKSLGSINLGSRPATPSAGAPQLILTGNVSLGSVEINYV